MDTSFANNMCQQKSLVGDILMWQKPKLSGAIFIIGLVLLMSLAMFSIISVIAHLALILLAFNVILYLYNIISVGFQTQRFVHPYRHYCPSDMPDFVELMEEADERLFRSTLYNPHHTLHVLLPPQSTTSQNYQLRQHVHDRQLPEHIGHLIDKNFITRLLYKDIKIFELDLKPSDETVHFYKVKCVEYSIGFIGYVRHVVLIENFYDSLKCALVLWFMTQVGGLFNGMTLAVLLYMFIFTVPAAYCSYQILPFIVCAICKLAKNNF